MKVTANEGNNFSGPSHSKNKFQLKGDVNAMHIRKESEETQRRLAQTISESAQKITRASPSEARDLESLEEKFKSLKRDTNRLVEEVKRYAKIQAPSYEKQYEAAKAELKKMAALPGACDNQKQMEEESFIELKKLLDNTAVIEAFPHQAAEFKLGVIHYALGWRGYEENMEICCEGIDRQLAQLLILSIQESIPDKLQRVWKEDGTSKPALPLEMAEEAYKALAISDNSNLTDFICFKRSCDKFVKSKEVMVSKFSEALKLRLEKLKNEEPTEEESDPISLLEVYRDKPSASKEVENSLKKEPIIFDLTSLTVEVLERLIPEHKRGQIVFDSIIGVSAIKFMQTCLSTRVKIKQIDKIAFKDRFIVELGEIYHTAHKFMEESKKYTDYTSRNGAFSCEENPENMMEEIKKIYQEYGKHCEETVECKLTGEELYKEFFSHAENRLKDYQSKRKEECGRSYKASMKGKSNKIFNQSENKATLKCNYESDLEKIDSYCSAANEKLNKFKMALSSYEDNSLQDIVFKKTYTRCEDDYLPAGVPNPAKNKAEESIIKPAGIANRFNNSIFSASMSELEQSSEEEEVSTSLCCNKA